MSDKKTAYEILSQVDVGEYVKADQGGNKYLTWSDCWAILLKYFPTSTFQHHENDEGWAFFATPFGVEVKVSVTVDGLTRTFTHPVLNTINKSMKIDGYSYTTKKGDRHVEACSTFDINTARMRALVKCIGLHGLALYLYRDDLQPELATVDSKQLQAMTNKIKEKNMKISEVCQSWNLPSLAKLHDITYDNFMAWMDGETV